MKVSLKLVALSAVLTAGIQADTTVLDRSQADKLVALGEEALPELRSYLKSDDHASRLRAKTSIGRITGQYGSETDLIWSRSMKEALEKRSLTSPEVDEKPIMLLHLFGSLDEEFC